MSLLVATLVAAGMAAQEGHKPMPSPDPEKGWHDASPPTERERASMQRRLPPHTLLAGGRADAIGTGPAAIGGHLQHVVFDDVGDGRIWAAANAYKASFGRDGFTYVPFLGSDAPANHPVAFALRAVRIGGHPLPLRPGSPRRAGDQVHLDHGAVTERFDCTLEHVEQTFVVDSTLPGDVELELQVTTDLAPDAAAGIRFVGDRGAVAYGNAHVELLAGPLAVPTTYEHDAIHIRVPAAARGDGPLVIDPIVSTSLFLMAAASDSVQPDIAYDATFEQYLVVWEYRFSATDSDIYCEFHDASGAAVAGSLASIDLTVTSHAAPRVANLNAFDRFLVVCQRLEQGRWQIYGRLRLAGAAPHPIVFPIGDPNGLGHCTNPDIGGDPGNGDRWFVAWQRELSANDFDIHARTVFADTSLGALILVENTSNTVFSLPQVSQSNGNGLAGSPCWMVVYQFRFAVGDHDVYGAAFTPTGTVLTPSTAIDTNTADDQVPTVSTPLTDHNTAVPHFFVTYERQNPPEARARILRPTTSNVFVNQVTPLSLTQAFGLGGFWVRGESDGCRIAAISGAPAPTVATLTYANQALGLHEAPQALTGSPEFPRLCSTRSSGGSYTAYGIACVDTSLPTRRIRVTVYDGRQPGTTVVRRLMGCTPMSIETSGRPYLGEAFSCSLQNPPSGLFGIVEGLPHAASTAFCTPCPIGVDLAGPIANFLLSGSATQPIPCSAGLVGATFAMQGYAFFGGSTCPSGLVFTDTIDFTIR